jgi:plasmid stabilization system protein ParE
MRMKKFPYAVYFVVDESKQDVLIVAVWHERKDIRKLTRRIKMD